MNGQRIFYAKFSSVPELKFPSTISIVTAEFVLYQDNTIIHHSAISDALEF